MSNDFFPDLGGGNHAADSTVISCPKTPTDWIDLVQQQGDSGEGWQETLERLSNFLSGNGWRTNSEVERERALKYEAERRKAVAWLKEHGATDEFLGKLTAQQQIDLYNAAQRGETSVTSDGVIINIVPAS
jgi:hypothetical protein